MSRFALIQYFLESGHSGTDAELALKFATDHSPKRGAEIVRSAISILIKKGVHISRRPVRGQRKQEYYIPFAKPVVKPTAKVEGIPPLRKKEHIFGYNCVYVLQSAVRDVQE